jgi:hypothetical protein
MKFVLVFFCVLLSASATYAAPASRSFNVAPGVDVPVNVYGANKQKLILWLPSEMGVVNADGEIAAQLAARGYEVWIADLFSARFLPVVPSSLAQIPATDVAKLIGAAAQSHATIYLLTSGHGAGITLAGAREWQKQKASHAHKIAGAVLLFPNLYAGSPDAGEAPKYLPIATHTRLPIFILQGDLSPWYWHLDEMKSALKKGGSQLAVRILPGMRDRFYFRPDANPAERKLGSQVATLISDSIEHLPTKNTRDRP